MLKIVNLPKESLEEIKARMNNIKTVNPKGGMVPWQDVDILFTYLHLANLNCSNCANLKLCKNCGHEKDNSSFHFDSPGDNWGAALHWFVPKEKE